MSINNVTLTGNLGRDAELRCTTEGTPLAAFSLAVNEYASGSKERVNWIDCTVWGKRAEVLAPYLTKGTKIAITGHLRQRTWEADDGTRRSFVGVTVEAVEFMSSRRDEGDAADGAGDALVAVKETFGVEPTPYNDEDIPF